MWLHLRETTVKIDSLSDLFQLCHCGLKKANQKTIKKNIHVCMYTGSHAQHARKYIQYTINMGIRISLIKNTAIDVCCREVLDCLFQLLTSAPQLFLLCTQGTMHQARAGEAVGVPQAGSSPHHPSSGLVGIPKKLQACSTSSLAHK